MGKYSEAVIRMKDYERTPEDEQAEIARLKMIAERNKKILNNLKKNSIQK